VSSSDAMVDVSADGWLDACLDRADRGLDVVDWLTAVDSSDRLFVLAHLVDPGTGNAEMLRCEIDPHAPRVASIAGRFPGAEWHERETAEMFGVEFAGRDALGPLLRREEFDGRATAPLRKAYALKARVENEWPGRDRTDRGRRRKLPPGVRVEWIDDE